MPGESSLSLCSRLYELTDRSCFRRESKERGSLQEGDEIEFFVSSYQYANGVINIIGQLDADPLLSS